MFARPSRTFALSRPTLALLALAFPTGASLDAQQWAGRDRLETERCTPLNGSGTEWIAKAGRAAGLGAIQGVLRFTATESDVQFFQSDRMYPPFISSTTESEFSFDPATGAERARAITADGGPGLDLVRTTQALFMIRDTAMVPVLNAYRYFEVRRPLNPLAVLTDWREATTTVVARCSFRDYPRIVLTRGIPGERLYLDEKSAMPVKYERVEPNTLWGQVRAEYVYATWWQAGPAKLPVVAVRYLDGVEDDRRDLSLPQAPGQQQGTDIPRDSAFRIALPNPLPDHSGAPDFGSREVPVDTVRVADETFLLTTPIYTHAVTMIRDTVYLMDATSGEWRSRADSTWIARLYPSHKAVVLVVTDLAWPHISGVRYWAARGATIATHRLSKPFLEQVLARRWTLKPDELERSRSKAAKIKWLVVDSSLALARGTLQLSVIDGVSSEGAVMAMVPERGFLWAGDYIQSASAPSVYAREVMDAVERAGYRPNRVAAQHLPLTLWTTVTSANPPS
jgi:hypothetical protein